jgi:hypothetical protein
MRFPKIVAAQRLQTWLLIAALVSIALIGLLVLDLTRNLRTVVISETNRSLLNASKELTQAGESWLAGHRDANPGDAEADLNLKRVSYDILRSYPDVEGGFVFNGKVVGHSFPSYTEPGSNLRQPRNEQEEVMAAMAESKTTAQPAHRILQDGKDLVLVSVISHPDGKLSAWCLRRLINFSDSNELNKRFILVGVMFVALTCNAASPQSKPGWTACAPTPAIAFRSRTTNCVPSCGRSIPWPKAVRSWNRICAAKIGSGSWAVSSPESRTRSATR